jgi:basic amino acid/polyamine antiporter, APA family
LDDGNNHCYFQLNEPNWGHTYNHFSPISEERVARIKKGEPVKRKLTFYQALAVGLGNIIGAGIFVMAGSAIDAAGPGALVAFAITAALAISVGLSTAELSSTFSSLEGGVYSFARETLGETMGFLVGWFRLIAYAVSGGAVALGFSGYLIGIGAPAYVYTPAAVLLILVLSLVELRGVRLASLAEEWLVLVKIVGLGVFVVAVFTLTTFHGINFTPAFPYGALGILSAANIAFFAYSGFNTIATLTPDVQDGEKTVPRAIISSIVISTSLYVLIVFSLLVALNWSSYGTASNPLSLALSAIRAPLPISLIVDFAALAATFAVTLSLLVAGSRTAKQMGEDKLLPSFLDKSSILPTVLVAAIMLGSLALGNVQSIAIVANFGIIFSYMLTGLEVAVARRKGFRPKFHSPGYPYTQAFATVLSIIMLLTLGLSSLTLGIITLILGMIIHSTYKHIVSARRNLADSNTYPSQNQRG